MTKPKVQLKKAKRKRPDGRDRYVWMLRWNDGRGRILAETVGQVGKMTKREAEAQRRYKQSRIDCRVIRPDRPDKMTLAQLVEYNRATIESEVRPATLVEYQLAAAHAIEAIGGSTLLTDIGRAEVGKLKTHLASEHRINGKKRPPCSKATIRKTITVMRAVFYRALEEEPPLVETNPFAKQGLRKVQSKQKRIFSREEANRMVEAAPDLWWQAFIELAVTSGLRRGEMLNLQWRDVNLDDTVGSVTVAAKRTGTFEVAGETYPILPWSAKDSDERTVPAPPQTVALLRRLKVKAGGSLYVFLSLQRLTALRRHLDDAGELPAKFNLANNLNRWFTSIQARARKILAERRKVELEKVDWPVGCIHDLRRTYGTWMAEVVPMHVLKVYLGHSDIATTNTYYLAVSDDAAKKVRDALSA